MLSSISRISEERDYTPIINYIRQIAEFSGGNKQNNQNIPKSITSQIEIKNIEFDPHIHSSLSDGITMHSAMQLGSILGLDGMAFADHHRDDLNDVILYNDDAYRILEIGGDDRISANMDVLEDVVREQRKSLKAEEIGSSENLDYLIRDYNRNNEDNIDSIEANELLRRFNGRSRRKKTDLFRSIERDYETWNDRKTEEFLGKNNFDHVVLSTHYIPEEFVEENTHPKQTQYLRKADVEHLKGLTEHSIGDVFEWYLEETKAKLLRTADLTELADDKVERLYENHGVEPYRDISELKKPIAEDTPVIHSHWDLILTSPHLRPFVHEEHIDEYLDLAEELDEVVEVNGRTIMKQRKTYTSDDNFYAPEDAEWFARKVIERAEKGDLDYTIASDAHSETEVIEQYVMLDSVLEDYDTKPLGRELYETEVSLNLERGIEKEVDRYKTEPLETSS